MAGGPVTQKCAMYGYYYNRKGERLVRYDFTKWGYNLLTQVPEATAIKLDTDPKYRAAYIKTHDIKPYVKKPESDDDVIDRLDGKDITRGELGEAVRFSRTRVHLSAGELSRPPCFLPPAVQPAKPCTACPNTAHKRRRRSKRYFSALGLSARHSCAQTERRAAFS